MAGYGWSYHVASSYAGGLPAVRAPAEPATDPVPLPTPRPLPMALGTALEQRASCRHFSDEALELADLSTLLGTAYGIRGEIVVEGASFRPRSVPSAGATYPLELHLLVRSVSGLPEGSYAYLAESDALARTGAGVPFPALDELFLGQPYLIPAAAVIVIAGALGRTTARYGDRGYRYVLFEAGHVMQNLLLAAAALELGSLPLGGFLDYELSANLHLDPAVVPLYATAVGPTTASEGGDLRSP